MLKFIELTSVRDTPLYVQIDSIVMVEAFTFADKPSPRYEGHTGARLTLSSNGCSDTAYCLELPQEVMLRLVKAN